MPHPRFFTSETPLAELIASAPTLLTTMSRFGLALGFGDKRVREVCAERGVDCDTFLAVANYLAGERKGETPQGLVSPKALMAYLKEAHAYFLDYALPDLRRRLLHADYARFAERDEWAFELTWHIPLRKFLCLQPALHLCLSEGVVGMVRCSMEL